MAFIDWEKIAYCAKRIVTRVNSIKNYVQQAFLPISRPIYCYHCFIFSVPDSTNKNSDKRIHIAV